MKKGVAVAKLRLGVGRDQGSALVVVMQNAELWDGHDAPASWRLDVSRLGAVAPERQMGAHGVVVIDIGAKQASEMPFVDHDEVVEAFPADGAYDALDERILPRRVGRDQNLMNAHVVDAAVEAVTINRIAVPEEIPRGRVIGKRVNDLLGTGCAAWYVPHGTYWCE